MFSVAQSAIWRPCPESCHLRFTQQQARELGEIQHSLSWPSWGASRYGRQVDPNRRGTNSLSDIKGQLINNSQKCRQINNISSTCSIVAALSSSVIERLHLTWARVERKGQLVPLQNLAQPACNFRECREFLKIVEKPCIPFIGEALAWISYLLLIFHCKAWILRTSRTFTIVILTILW